MQREVFWNGRRIGAAEPVRGEPVEIRESLLATCRKCAHDIEFTPGPKVGEYNGPSLCPSCGASVVESF